MSNSEHYRGWKVNSLVALGSGIAAVTAAACLSHAVHDRQQADRAHEMSRENAATSLYRAQQRDAWLGAGALVASLLGAGYLAARGGRQIENWLGGEVWSGYGSNDSGTGVQPTDIPVIAPETVTIETSPALSTAHISA